MDNWKSKRIKIWYGHTKFRFLTGGPRYNTSIFKKLHAIFFKGFIINTRTDRYNIMCYIDAHENGHQSYSCGDGSSSGCCPLPKTSTTEAL